MSDVAPQSKPKRQRRASISNDTLPRSQPHNQEAFADPPASSSSVSESASVRSGRAHRDQDFQHLLAKFLDVPTSGSEDEPPPSKPALARKRAQLIDQTPPPSPQPATKAKRPLTDVQLANLAAGRERANQSRREKKKEQRDKEAEAIAARAVAAALAQQQQQQKKHRAPKRKQLDPEVSSRPTKHNRVQGQVERQARPSTETKPSVARRLQFEEEPIIHPHLQHAAF
jgi:hypothetical protein